MADFSGLFSKGTSLTESPKSGGVDFSNLFRSQKTQKQPPEPPVLPPNSNTQPSLPEGGGYGQSNLKDASGRPFLTFQNKKLQESQLLKDRVAVPFDPTKPQKLDASVLKNGRLPEEISQAIKHKLGGEISDELDHRIALELAGSNDPENLGISPGRQGFQLLRPSTWIPSLLGTSAKDTDQTENKLAKQVVGGEISLIDAQRQLAKAKGITLAEDQPASPIEPSGITPTEENKSTARRIGDGMVNFLNEVGKGIVDPLAHPVKTIESIPEDVKQKSDALWKNLADRSDEMKDVLNPLIRHPDPAGDIAKTIEWMKSIADLTLAPASLTFDVASKIPGPHLVAQALGFPFQAIGALSPTQKMATDKFVGWLQIPEESKNELSSALNNMATLGEQVTAGAAMYQKIQTLMERGAGITPEVAKSIAEESKTETSPKNTESASPQDTVLSEDVASGKRKIITVEGEEKVIDVPEKELENVKLPTINTDEQARTEAFARVGGTGRGGSRVNLIENVDDPEIRDAYHKWVGRKSYENRVITGELAAKQFEGLRDDGMDAVVEFQKGDQGAPANADKAGQYAEVRDFLNDLLDKEQRAGIPVERRENYLPQYWRNTPEEIQRAYQQYAGGGGIGLRPGFTKEATFPSYEEGMKAGLTPMFDNIPDMINQRVRASEKAFADREFADFLMNNNLVQPHGEGESWEAVPRFPRQTFKTNDGNVYRNSSVYMPNGIADLINNQLEPPVWWLKGLADVATKLKNVALSAGIPGTAINMHGFNEWAASALEASDNPSLVGAATKYMIYPNSATDFIDEHLNDAQELVRDGGLKMSSEDHLFDEVGNQDISEGTTDKIGTGIKKVTDTLYKMFGANDFQKMIPALKLMHAISIRDELIDGGMDRTEALKEASVKANETFGGLNLDFMGRDKNIQNALRITVFAPDFWESRLRAAGGMAESLNPASKSPIASTYRKSVATLIGSYIAMNIVNKVSSGRYMYQNPAGHQMDIQFGKDSKGKVRWLRPFGTAVDFVRLPLDISKSIIDGDFSPLSSLIGNRVSTIMQPAIRFMTNTDAFGNPIFGRTKYGKKKTIGEQLTGAAKTLPVVPQVVQGLAGLAQRDKQSTEQSFAQALSLPVRYNQAAKSTDIIDLKEKAREGIRKGDFTILNELIKGGIISKKGRARFIKDARTNKQKTDSAKEKRLNKLRLQEKAAADILGR